MEMKWWQTAIIYQVYIRSFYDSNGDGIGDFKGLTEKLSYLEELGVNAVWVSPHYKSPMDDNGYDVSNYYEVSTDYGTLDDVKSFIHLAHEKNIKVIFDLVLNHTSDEHDWFLAAKDPNHPEHNKYHDYYIWQKPKYDNQGQRKMPTNWRSWFGGPVWEYNEPTNEYYLHIFSKKMPDLNWHNENMKNDLKDITRWLISLGVDGFRVDASNHLEKNWDFPDANPGYEHFSSLPKHHEYLKEFGEDIFYPQGIMTMGESGGATKEEALQYCGYNSREFDMLIHFGHCWADGDDSNYLTPGKWAKGTVDVRHIKNSFEKWYKMLGNQGWNLIYWHNHDHPRIISHYGNDNIYYKESGKMLAMTLYMMPGTPIVYQGEEIGMTNVDYGKLDDFKDVEVFTEYDNFMSLGASHEIAMQALRDRSRDNARSPFQWDDSQNGGFTNVTPWMKSNKNYKSINLQQQMSDRDSIFATYKKLFEIRKTFSIHEADIEFLDIEHTDLFIYKIKTKMSKFIIISNFRDYKVEYNLELEMGSYMVFLSNYHKEHITENLQLEPFESIILKVN